MGKTAEEVLTGFLSTNFKLDDEGVTALKEADGSFKDDTNDKLTELHAARVATLRGDVEKLKSDRYSQGKREALEGLEKELRDEFGVKETDKRGKELVKAIIAASVNANGTIDENKVKAHPLYIKLEEQVTAFPKTLEEKLKAKEDELTTGFKAERNTARIIDRALTRFKGMNPILPKNPEVARAQMTLLENYLKGHKFDIVEKDGDITDIIPLKADGSGRLEDSIGHHVSFDSLVEAGAKRFYEFHEGEHKSTAPNPAGSGGGNGGGGGAAVKLQSFSDYAKEHARIEKQVADPTERQKLWAELKAAGVAAGVVA